MSRKITTQYHCDCCDVFEQFDSPSVAYKYGTVKRLVLTINNTTYSADLCPDCKAAFDEAIKNVIKNFNLEEE